MQLLDVVDLSVNIFMRLFNLLLILSLVACSSKAPDQPKFSMPPPMAPRPSKSYEPYNVARPASVSIPAHDAKDSERRNREIEAMEKSRSNEIMAARVSKPVSNTERQADRHLDQLKERASLACSIQEQVNFPKRVKSQLIVDIGPLPQVLAQNLSVKGTVTQAQFNTTRVITAKIMAPDFKIVTSSDEEQAIIDGQPAIWDWDLEPKEVGSFDVKLLVSARVQVNGKERATLVKTFEKVVKVEITQDQIIKNWLDKHWENLAQWLWTSAIVPLALYWWHYRRRRRSKKSR